MAARSIKLIQLMSAAPAAARDDTARASRIIPVALALLLAPLCLAGCETAGPTVVAPTAPDAKSCKAKPKPPNCPKKIAAKPKPKSKLKWKPKKAPAPSFANWRLRLSETPERERADRSRDAARSIQPLAAPVDPGGAMDKDATPITPVNERPQK